MALELTKEQEAALVTIIKREMDKPALIAAAELAQAEYDAKLAEYYAARDVVQLAANAQTNAVDATYRAELEAKRKAVEDAKKAVSADAVAVKP